MNIIDRGSLSSLLEAFSSADSAPLHRLVGDNKAEFIGPAWLRYSGPLLMIGTGMPAWFGKRFRAGRPADTELAGVNLLRGVRGLKESVPMTARVAPSRIDGRDALIVSYPGPAPWPWRNVNDELRPISDNTLLGLTFGIPGSPSSGAPFLLHSVTSQS